MFETNPRNERCTEGEVEESFVGDGEEDEDWRERQEDDHESVEIVIIWVEAM